MKKGKQASTEPTVATEGVDGEKGETSAQREARSPELEEGAVAEADLSGPLDHLQSEFESLNDRHLRLAAEFTNYRRRAENEMSEAWGRAQADLLRRFLDVLDDLQRVAALDPAAPGVSVSSVVEGVDLVERKFARVLEEARVELVDPAPGDSFDPATMEAVMRIPSPSPEDDDTVDQVFQKGYRFWSHLVRPARVSVRKHE